MAKLEYQSVTYVINPPAEGEAEQLLAELDAYAAVGLFGDSEPPDAASLLSNDIITSVYDANGMVIWPS